MSPAQIAEKLLNLVKTGKMAKRFNKILLKLFLKSDQQSVGTGSAYN